MMVAMTTTMKEITNEPKIIQSPTWLVVERLYYPYYQNSITYNIIVRIQIVISLFQLKKKKNLMMLPLVS